MRRTAKISDILKPLADMPHQAYLNDVMQVADVMQWILDQTGPADIRISSFSISEEFLRRVYFIGKKSLIKSLEIVLDHKATNKTMILWPFISRVVQKCYLSTNHSKVLLVSNVNWKVAMVTSQNLTRGNRFESGFISTDPKIFDALHEQMQYIITRQSVPFHEIYARTAGDNQETGCDMPEAL